jgi:hypothetical protein
MIESVGGKRARKGLSIKDLPYDCAFEILMYLPIRDLFENIIFVSQKFYNLVHSTQVLKSKLVNDLNCGKYKSLKEEVEKESITKLKERIKLIIGEKIQLILPSNTFVEMQSLGGNREFKFYAKDLLKYEGEKMLYLEDSDTETFCISFLGLDETECFRKKLRGIISKELKFLNEKGLGMEVLNFIPNDYSNKVGVTTGIVGKDDFDFDDDDEGCDFFNIYLNPKSEAFRNICEKMYKHIEKEFSEEKFGSLIYHPYLSKVDYFDKKNYFLNRFSNDQLENEERKISDFNLIEETEKNVNLEKLKKIHTLYFFGNLIKQNAMGDLSIWKLKNSIRSALKVASNLKNIYFEFRLLERYNYKLKDKEIFLKVGKSIFVDLQDVFRNKVKEVSEKEDITNNTRVFEAKYSEIDILKVDEDETVLSGTGFGKSNEKALKLYFVSLKRKSKEIPERIERLKINVFKPARVALNFIYSGEFKMNYRDNHHYSTLWDV